MVRSTVANGVSALVGLSAVIGLLALVGGAVLAAERLEAAAAESPVFVAVLFTVGLATVGLAMAVRRTDFARAFRRSERGRRGWTADSSRSRDRQSDGPARLTRAEAREVLDVGLTADEAEIKRAFRDRVADVHPDRGGDEAAFKRLTAAYERMREEY